MELGHILQSSYGAIFRKRMVVGVQLEPHGFGTISRSPDSREGDEEALIGGESVHNPRLRLSREGTSVGPIGNREPAKITQRLTEHQLSVMVQSFAYVKGVLYVVEFVIA